MRILHLRTLKIQDLTSQFPVFLAIYYYFLASKWGNFWLLDFCLLYAIDTFLFNRNLIASKSSHIYSFETKYNAVMKYSSRAIGFSAWFGSSTAQPDWTRTTNVWWLGPKFSTAQIHTPIPNRKSCKIYENLSLLQSNAKSQTRDTQWQTLSRHCYPKYPKIPHNLFGWSAQSDKIFGLLIWKKALIGCPRSVIMIIVHHDTKFQIITSDILALLPWL